jgi:type IV secretory pathway protease TraF
VKNHGEFFCNNVFLGSAKTHSKEGIQVKAFEYNGIIPEGKFFAMGSCIDSYDSRYVGLEDKNDIKAVALPVF